MSTTATAFIRLPSGTYLLVFAQALNLTVAVLSVTISALVGLMLASSPGMGTVPYGVQFASVMIFTYPATMLMKVHGRKPVFLGGAFFLCVAGVVGYLAVSRRDFYLLIACHGLLGAFIACGNSYRFAATDNLPPSLKSQAISLVVAGGVLAAVAGPAIANSLRQVEGYVDFSLCYAAFSAAGLLTFIVIAAWQPLATAAGIEKRQIDDHGGAPGAKRPIAIAVISSAGAYLVMNLIMVQSALALGGICSFGEISTAIQAHVLAMFAPSFFTGRLIRIFGVNRIIGAGAFLLLVAASIGAVQLEYKPVFLSLIFLGVGWNFLFVGGGCLLTSHVDGRSRYRWQGINDTVIAACATLGAFLPAWLFSAIGWSLTNAIVLFSGLVLVWICWRLGNNQSSTQARIRLR